MKVVSSLLFTSLLAAASSVSGAEAPADLTAAVKKLSEAPNYSWTSTPKTEGTERRQTAALEGKAEKTGLIHLKTSSGDTSYEVAYKGDKVIVNYNEEWIEPSELPVESSRVEERLKALKVTPLEQANKLLSTSTDLKKDA